jgi:predicted kinase
VTRPAVPHEDRAAAPQHELAAISPAGPATTSHDRPATTSHDEPATTSHHEPAAISHARPAAAPHAGPATTSHDQPAATSRDEPAATSHPGPAAAPHAGPATTSHDEPATTSHDEPAAISYAGPAAAPHDGPATTSHGAPAAAFGARGGPALIVVSGRPGAGKTTLAHAVARGVGCPAVCRDEIREGMAHAGTPDPTMLRTFEAFFATVELLLRAGVTVVAEAAFQDKLWRPRLEPLAALGTIRIIRCDVDPAVARERIVRRRLAVPARAAHGDRAWLDGPPPDWTPIAMDLPTLAVDTTDGYSPALPEIIAFAGAT